MIFLAIAVVSLFVAFRSPNAFASALRGINERDDQRRNIGENCSALALSLSLSFYPIFINFYRYLALLLRLVPIQKLIHN
jgi:hypothetical protein